MTTPDAGFLATGGQADEAIGKTAGIAIDGKFGIPAAQDNAASDESRNSKIK